MDGEWKGAATEIVGGGSAITTLDVATSATERLWKGDESIHDEGNVPNFAVAKDGKTSAVIRSDWQRPPEIWTGPIGDWKQVTHNNNFQPKWGAVKNVEWTNEGASIQGWLLYPRGFDPEKKYPMVVSVHGGPAHFNAQHWPADRFDMSTLSALGYFVFFPHPRGSLRARRGVHPRECEGSWRRRFTGHPGGTGRGAEDGSGGSESRGCGRLELRRLHDDIHRNADQSV